MSISNAITLPRPDAVAHQERPSSRLRRITNASGERPKTRIRADAGALIVASTLVLTVVCSALIVLAATAHPSLLSAVTRPDFFPSWMSGPLGGVWSSLSDNATLLRWGVSLAMILMFTGYALSIRYVPRVRTRWIVAAIVAAHAIFFLAPPLMLTDVFNYINYGRMEIVHHLNPYTSVPALEPHLDPSFPLSNWHQLSSPYGPLFTIITFAVVPLGVAASFWAIKALVMLSSLATVLLVWKSAKLLGRNPTRSIFILGLNPIVLMWGLGGDHNDFVMLLFLMLGIYLLLRSAGDRGLLGFEGVEDLTATTATRISATARRWVVLPATMRDLQPFPARFRISGRTAELAPLRAGDGNGHSVEANGHAASANGHAASANGNGNGHAATANGNGNGHAATANGDGNGHVATANGNGSGHVSNGNGHAATSAGPRWVPAGGWAPLAMELTAGASLVAAVAIKASAAVIVPVLLAGLARNPRRLLRVLLGVLLGAIVLAACTLVAFGPHLPAIGTQASLVTEFSVPNVLGLALGQGGATTTLRAILSVGLLVAVAFCAWLAWHRRDSITAAGWASIALIVTLSWVLPWYVLWVLPLAALSSSRRLRRATLVLGAYLIVIWMPATASIVGTLGLHPSKTAIGEIHQRQVKGLMRP